VLTLAEVEEVARGAPPPPLTEDDRRRIGAGRALVDRLVAEHAPVYGVTTGFGDLSKVRIDPADVRTLQRNLIRSHAVGAGAPLDSDVVRGMLLLLQNSLRKGYSGARVELVEQCLALLEAGVVPVVPSQGSVGSSGDLAPLAHLALVLVGEGEALVSGDRLPGGEALRRAGLEPVELEAKEGLALINGTHLMAAAGVLALREAERVLQAAIVASALSLEAFKGSTAPFDPRLHELRPQPGPQAVAARLRGLLQGSPIVQSHANCGRVQDPYTLRCIPQVLGAIGDALAYVVGALERELDAVTDNPLVFPQDGDVRSGGNFHGQPLSLPLDHLALAACELASFSERRTYALLSPSYAGLPPFLTPHPGLNSGLMIAQYVAASLVNECTVLAHPAGAASIPTSAGMEDYNSMGAWGALKARSAVRNAAHVVAIELACGCQGVEFHRPLRSTPPLERAIAQVRERVPRLEQDRSLSGELAVLADDLRLGRLVLTAD
jgi:histidine ammonia-lyase